MSLLLDSPFTAFKIWFHKFDSRPSNYIYPEDYLPVSTDHIHTDTDKFIRNPIYTHIVSVEKSDISQDRTEDIVKDIILLSNRFDENIEEEPEHTRDHHIYDDDGSVCCMSDHWYGEVQEHEFDEPELHFNRFSGLELDSYYKILDWDHFYIFGWFDSYGMLNISKKIINSNNYDVIVAAVGTNNEYIDIEACGPPLFNNDGVYIGELETTISIDNFTLYDRADGVKDGNIIQVIGFYIPAGFKRINTRTYENAYMNYTYLQDICERVEEEYMDEVEDEVIDECARRRWHVEC